MTKLTFAIGDVHGHFDYLMEMVNRCVRFAEQRDEEYSFVFLGDYIDRGPKSADVVEFIRNFPYKGVFIRGNHEDMMKNDQQTAMANGGVQTVESYREKYGDSWHPKILEDIEWLNELPLRHEDEFRHYVHAGFYPGIPVDKQTPLAMMWIRNEFLKNPYDFGKLVVHGHTPYNCVNGVDRTTYRMNLDTASCFGGHMTAAVFNDEQRDPISFIQFRTPKIVTVKEIEEAYPA